MYLHTCVDSSRVIEQGQCSLSSESIMFVAAGNYSQRGCHVCCRKEWHRGSGGVERSRCCCAERRLRKQQRRQGAQSTEEASHHPHLPAEESLQGLLRRLLQTLQEGESTARVSADGVLQFKNNYYVIDVTLYICACWIMILAYVTCSRPSWRVFLVFSSHWFKLQNTI